MKKVLTFLALICVLNVLMGAGLVGFLAATGRLDREKFNTIADVLRHPGTPNRFRAQVYDLLEPRPAAATASAPASQPAGRPADAAALPATADERIDYLRQTMEQEWLRLENERQDLRHQHELLVSIRAETEGMLKKISEERKAFEAAQAQSTGKSVDENFQKSLALYDELKPKQIKELFFPGMAPELVARYLQGMENDRAAKIISEFQTPDERTFIGGVLERIRTGGTNSASGGRGAGASAVPGT